MEEGACGGQSWRATTIASEASTEASGKLEEVAGGWRREEEEFLKMMRHTKSVNKKLHNAHAPFCFSCPLLFLLFMEESLLLVDVCLQATFLLETFILEKERPRSIFGTVSLDGIELVDTAEMYSQRGSIPSKSNH
jgi:hypothetical protein